MNAPVGPRCHQEWTTRMNARESKSLSIRGTKKLLRISYSKYCLQNRRSSNSQSRRFTPAAFFSNSRNMSELANDEFTVLLARAFDLAWKGYYRPSRVGAISASLARPALAKH